MIEKKQLLTLVSIAVVSFLIGTMLNMNLLAIGKDEDDGSPWDQVWTAISELQSTTDSLNTSLTELQDRVSIIEEETSRVKTIRFYDPSEYSTSAEDYETVFTFEWTPTDSTNNVVLMMAVYTEVNCTVEPLEEAFLHWQLNFTGSLPWADSYSVGSQCTSYEDFEYTWTEPASYSSLGHWIPPNQQNYTFDFQILCRNGVAYFRNISIIMTVVDGLPAESS